MGKNFVIRLKRFIPVFLPRFLRVFVSKENVRYMSDDETLSFLEKNKNFGIVRFGNSEFSLLAGTSVGTQDFSSLLQRELKEILLLQPTNYLLALPVDTTIKNLRFRNQYPWDQIWKKTPKLFMELYVKDNYDYGSPFCFRIKDVRTINLDAYLNRIESLINDKKIIYIGPSKGKNSKKPTLKQEILTIDIPSKNAYDHVDNIIKQVQKVTRKNNNILVLIVAGATGTVLSARLNKLGVLAYDFGQYQRHLEFIGSSFGNSQDN